MLLRQLQPMTPESVRTTSPLATGDDLNIASCAFGHRTHAGTCPGCQQARALRHAAQLNAAIMANARWKAGSLPPEQRRERELDTVDWKGRIRNALDEHRLVLYAQPIIDVNSREVVMHELLVRMVDHDGAIIAPGRFLPAAEECGLIEEIDRWVIIQAAQLAAGGLKVHFNISGKSLGSRELISDLVRTLRDTGADPGLLVCEITETALASNEAVAHWFAHEFAPLGGGIALDDFDGFPVSKRLPLTTLKINVEVVRHLLGNPNNQRVVKSIVNLACEFGRNTMALGVEADGTLALLGEYGVDYAQGFAIGRPAPIDTLS
jgi:EAL domain-containing protein (putative c-di-GMP-specific phosphodiesterase class I)